MLHLNMYKQESRKSNVKLFKENGEEDKGDCAYKKGYCLFSINGYEKEVMKNGKSDRDVRLK